MKKKKAYLYSFEEPQYSVHPLFILLFLAMCGLILWKPISIVFIIGGGIIFELVT